MSKSVPPSADFSFPRDDFAADGDDSPFLAPVDPEEEQVISAPEAASVDDESAGPQRCTFILRKELAKRIDVYLQQRLRGISRSKVQQLIEAGGVTINEKIPKSSTIIHEGDVIDVILPPPAVRQIVPEPIALNILYEDAALIVLNKHANIIVHPARGQNTGTIVNALAWHFKQKIEAAGGAWKSYHTRGLAPADRRRQKQKASSPPPAVSSSSASASASPTDADLLVPGLSSVGAADFRPGIVHRLDKNTTGVMVVAKHDQAHWQIARQFEDRSTLKAYLAIAHGNFDQAGGVIDEPIGKHPTIREAYAVRRDRNGKHAVTIYRVREQYRGYALVELELKTGRTHQIRVHLSYLGHPIVGDVVYGGEPIGTRELDHPLAPAGGRKFVTFARERDDGLAIEQKARKRSDLLLAHPALHAAFLRFVHPFSQQTMTFTAPVHQPVLGLIHALRLRPLLQAPVVTEGYWVDLASAVPAV